MKMGGQGSVANIVHGREVDTEQFGQALKELGEQIADRDTRVIGMDIEFDHEVDGEVEAGVALNFVVDERNSDLLEEMVQSLHGGDDGD